jgi:carboxyl-terminal processing protease
VRVAPAAALAAAALWCAQPARAGQPAQVDMQRILDMAELEAGFDTIRAEYYRAPSAQRLIDGARVGMASYLRGRGIADPALPYGHANGSYAHDLHELDKVYLAALVHYGDRIDAHALIQDALAGELAALGDPYSQFFTPPEYHAFTSFLQGRVTGGIGVVIVLRDGQAIVDRVFAGSPAERAGLQPGDAIAAVDGVPVAGLAGGKLVDRIHGDVGTVVRLSIIRGGAPLPAPVEIVRDVVRVGDVEGKLLPGGVGYMRLRAYGQNAAKDLAALRARLVAGGARALVLDLRDDGGGYEDVAVAVTSLFVATGPIVTIEDRRGRKTTHSADGRASAPLPLAVLVNENTASGAEITAAAIAERGAGVLVGKRTFGKGLVQQIFPLPDGSAMKLTTERYLTAAGNDIDRKGIAPAVVVEEPPGSVPGEPGRDPQLDRALALLPHDAAPAATP